MSLPQEVQYPANMLTQTSPPASSEPDEWHSSDRKRRRKALSCYDCRRRKLRCDREYPCCGRCRKGGQADSCIYESGSLEPKEYGDGEKKVAGFDSGAGGATIPAGASAQPSLEPTAIPGKPVPDASSSKLLLQARRIAQLESRLVSFEASQPTATWQTFGEVTSVAKIDDKKINTGPKQFLTSPRNQPETILFRGKNYKTQYYGGTNPTSLIAHFPELRSFMKESITHHASLSRVQRDIKALQVTWKAEKAEAAPSKDLNLLDLLPGQDTVDHLVRLYFDTFESAYRILHAPTFRKDYQALWQDPQAARPAFVVIVLLVMAAVNCASSREQPTYIGDSATAREAAILWIETCEWWLQHQSQKHAYLGLWQIRCLLLLAKMSNTLKKKQTWTSAGTLMRQAMSAGFHRDPSLLGAKVSVFDQEMRRRLWATIVELELQASIDRGMTSASAGFPCDVAPALNINDEDLEEDSIKPPIHKPWDEYTETSFLSISRSSLSLRVSLNSLLNEFSSHAKYEDVLVYDEKIMQKLREIPSGIDSEGIHKGRKFPDLLRTLLDVQLRQFLILLHGPFARQAETNSRYSLSKMVCFNAAGSILDQHTRLTTSGIHTLLLFRNDVFRAALSICHTIHVSIAIQNELVLHNLSNGFFQYVEDALVLLEDKITRLGTGYTHYWYISAAYGLIRSEKTPGNATLQKQQAIDRVARQYFKVRASQEDLSVARERLLLTRSTKTSATETQMTAFDEAANQSGLPFTALDVTQQQTALQATDPQFEEYYFGDPSAWTMDNLWTFDPLDLPEL